MMRTQLSSPRLLVTSLATLLACATIVEAVPYAGQVRNTSGTTWEFVLNEDADQVTITRDGGNAIVLNSPTADRYTFDLAAFSTFDIEVTKSAAAGLTKISDDANPFNNYFRPAGLAINTNPSSEFFGTVYVGNSRGFDTAAGRSQGDGIYALRPDLQGVDFSSPAWAVPDPNDTTQAKVGAGWDVSGANSPYRIAVDDGGNVIAGDWSDASGGIKFIGPDLTGGGLVLAGQEGPGLGFVDPSGPFDGSGSPFVHGSIRGTPNVQGTVGVDLVVSALDEDLNRNPIGLFDGTYPDASLPDTDGDGFPTDGNHVWRWDVGSETNSFAKPTLIIDVGGDPGQLGSDTGSTIDRPFQLDLNIGVRADAEFFPQIGTNGLWIVTEPRFDGDESGIIIVEADETGVNPPNVLWASRQFTIDNDLDSLEGDTGTVFGITGVENPNSDVFRNTGSVEVSPDGSTLYVHRWVNDNNVYLDAANLPGPLLAIPLDENGIPDIQIDDNGTPGDTSDDFFTNLESAGTIAGQNEEHNVEVDAAGNIYLTNNSSELLTVFSPGGDSTTTFSFDGVNFSFAVGGGGSFVLGDTNNDGVVNTLDIDPFVLALTNPAQYAIDFPGVDINAVADINDDGMINTLDIDPFVALLTGAASGAPEPSALALAALALALCPRRNRA